MREQDLHAIYDRRWKSAGTHSDSNRNKAWDALVKEVFQPLVDAHSTVLDLGSGQGHFIKRIVAEKKIAVDLDSSNEKYLDESIRFVSAASHNLGQIEENSVGLCFTSNLFEHLDSITTLFDTLVEIKRITRKDHTSRLVIMIPNIRKVGLKFYDFIDHTLPLSDKSLVEALEITGYQIETVYPGFFPYSASNSPTKIPPFIFSLYLKIPGTFRPFSGQMLVIASPWANENKNKKVNF